MIPSPVNIDYYVTVYTRFMTDHMMPLVGRLAQYDKIHPKFAYLDVPQDGTKRTLQLLGGPASIDGYDENNKRYFSVQYKIRVFSEILNQVYTFGPANEINLDITTYSNVQDLTTEELSRSIGLLSVGGQASWNVQSVY